MSEQIFERIKQRLLDKKPYSLNQQPLSLQPYQVLWLMPAAVDSVSPLWAMQTD
ncbi:hypothetical protein P8S54_05180 [Thiomicrospira sp. R3]|uniref:hypothetical protein n=1 Tax=Thiomicrospira sp. R3 TaxID=3035472 RepID=UPI00259BAFE1|nr:hypothetical protein [Thiomicrospira sp. R3]WFE69696.1 hypothetical protein P8S54_05180 [Thiomicrospira sp. R3]